MCLTRVGNSTAIFLGLMWCIKLWKKIPEFKFQMCNYRQNKAPWKCMLFENKAFWVSYLTITNNFPRNCDWDSEIFWVCPLFEACKYQCRVILVFILIYSKCLVKEFTDRNPNNIQSRYLNFANLQIAKKYNCWKNDC